MLKAYKYRLYPTKAQAVLLEKHFGCCRWVWNWALEKKTKLWETEKKSIFCSTIKKEIPKLKEAEETKWLSDVNSQSLQSVLVNLDMAYTKFFREKEGYPKFKKKQERQSFQCPQFVTVDFKLEKINLPKIKSIKIVTDRQFEGQIKTVTVSRIPTGKYFASILVETGKAEPKSKKRIRSDQTVGIDLGLKNFATLSTGEKVANPKYLKWSLRKLRRFQRCLSRRKKGSNNRNKQRLKVAIIHEKVINQRKDFHHKLSTRLIRENQAVAIETLNVSGMQKNRKLARAIQDAGWASFVSMLEYKARWYGKTILKIGQFEPSSKLCTCGVINRELKLSDRTWKCGSCGSTHDRDILAANNIKRMGLNPRNFIGREAPESTPVEIDNGRSSKQESFVVKR